MSLKKTYCFVLALVLPLLLSAQGITSGEEYIIKHVKTGKYLGGANSWGTQASLLNNTAYTFKAVSSGGKYMLDSHTYNSSTDHYLGSNGYIDNAGSLIDIVPVEGGFTMATDGLYYANSYGTIVTCESSNKADVWQFISVKDAIKNIESGDDVTFLIKAANFSRNHYHRDFVTSWIVNASNFNMSGGENTNCCAESWTSTFNIYQSISVPNGTYKLTAQAALTDYSNAYDNRDYPVVFANEKTSLFKNMEVNDRATSMEQLSGSFSAGKYAIDPITVTVTDGTLRVGVRGTRTDTWAIWDNFVLTCEHATYATITADANNSVKITNLADNKQTYLVAGSNRIAPGKYKVASSNANYALYKVIRNKVEIPETDGYYLLDIADGDVIDVKSTWLDENGEQMMVTLSCNDMSAIKSLVAGWTLYRFKASTSGGETLYSVNIPAGSLVRITLNVDYLTEDALEFYAREDHTVTTTPIIYDNAMVLHHVSGNDILYLLDEKPVVSFAGEDVTFVIDTDTISYKSADIQKVTYGYFDASEYLPGDVNGSLDVTISDATTLIEYLNGTNNVIINERNADTNRNGMVDADDIKKTVRIIMKSK